MLVTNKKFDEAKQLFVLWLKPLVKNPWFYLLGIFTTLAVLHLGIIIDHPVAGEEASFYALYWIGILFLLWQNRQQETTTTWFSSWLGLGLLLLVISRPLHLWYLDTTLFRIGPVVAALGLGILCFGFVGIRQHWRLFLLLCLMLIPYSFINGFLASRLHFSELTANISAFSLHYLGFQAVSQGALVKLPTGQVEVLYYCTGGLLIVWLLKLTLLISVVVPLNWQQRLGLVLSAIGTGFLVGCVRVALLAVVVNNKRIFEYWHSYTGGSIFMVAATITYAALCNWIIPLKYLPPTKPIVRTIEGKKRLFLAFTWLAIILTYISSINGKRLLAASTLPDSLVLNSWQQVKVKNIDKQKPETALNPSSESVQFGKDYSYFKNSQRIELQMRYVVSTRGESNPFLQRADKNSVKDSQKTVKYIKGIGHYTLYSDDQQAHLTACINSRGGSTVTSAQFMQNRYTFDLTWNRVALWILGKEVLRDDRCLWTQLSVPSGELLASDIYPVLESIWATNYATWQALLQIS